MKIITTRNILRQFDSRRVRASVEVQGNDFFAMALQQSSFARSARVARVNLKRFVRDGIVALDRKGEALTQGMAV